MRAVFVFLIFMSVTMGAQAESQFNICASEWSQTEQEASYAWDDFIEDLSEQVKIMDVSFKFLQKYPHELQKVSEKDANLGVRYCATLRVLLR